MRFKDIAAGCVLIALLVETSAFAATPLAERLQFATDRARQQDCASSLKVLKDIVRERAFAALPEEQRVAVFELGAECASNLGDVATTYRYALEGTRLNGASHYLWQLRFGAEVNEKRHAAVVDTLEVMARQNPAALNALKIAWLFPVYRDLREQADTSLRTRFLAVLTSRDYQPVEVMVTGDVFKGEYAAILAEAGKTAEAASLLSRIVDPYPLIRVSVDKRVRALLPPDFDARDIMERRLAQIRDVAAAHPESIEPVLRLAGYLGQLGRPDEALATLQAAHPDDAHAIAFTDLDEHRNWWWNTLSNTYEMLGRDDDAIMALRKAGEIAENGNLNVSQTLNLGSLQFKLGRPAAALEAVAVFADGQRRMSPYGHMVLRLVRGCALLALGRPEEAKADLVYASSHEKDHPTALMYLSLCGGDMDTAAVTLIRQLDDPDDHVDALLTLSDYDPPPVGPAFKGFEARLPELKVRPDVQAAIARAGGTRRLRLQFP